MTMVVPLGWQVLDANGDPYSGAKAYTYATGTSTPQTTYSNAALSTPHANPIVADAAGRFAAVYGPTTTDYKVVLKTSADVEIATYDPVQMTGTPGAGSIGTAQLDDAAVTLAKMADIATASVIGRKTAGTGVPERMSITETLDLVAGTATKGDLLVRDTSAMARLAAVASGKYLTSAGVGALPVWSSGGLILLSTLTAASSAALDFTGVNSTYGGYVATFEDILPATDNASFHFLSSIDGGSSFITTGTYDYVYGQNNGAALAPGGSATGTAVILGANLGNIAGEGVKGFAYIAAGGAVAFATTINSQIHYRSNSSGPVLSNASGGNSTTTAVNAFRFVMSTGNIASGIIRIYGIPE